VRDLLVPLLKLPPLEPHLAPLRARGIVVRRSRSYEMSQTRRFVLRLFTEQWADETQIAFSRVPISCHVATYERKIIGFAVADVTARGFFGPTGVDPAYRGKGLGSALLLAALHGLRDLGYVYGIIGWAGPISFYMKTVNAIPIEGSVPGIYSDLLDPDE
jgi:GNAT superfamily N-acetyltransferase